MRVLRRLLLGILILTLGLGVALAVSIPVDSFLNRGKLETLTNTAIPSPAGEVKAYIAPVAASGPRPAVIMIHEFWGIRPSILDKADALAEEGYFVVAPDTFRGQTTGWLPKAIWQTLRKADEEVDADLEAVYAWLQDQPEVDAERIMVMGFCFGGGAALRYSLSQPGLAATGVFYGSLITDPDRLAALPGPLLGIFGAEDRSIPVEEVETFDAALETAGVPHEVRLFEGVGHAFVGSLEEIRAGGAAVEAWDTFLAFADQTSTP